MFSIGLNRAVSVIAEKIAKGPGRGRAGTPAALKTLGAHPADGQPITVRDGKYGPYVNHGKTNATLPKGKDPQSVTLEEAVEFITAKAGKAPVKKALQRRLRPQGCSCKESARQEDSRQENCGEEGLKPWRAASALLPAPNALPGTGKFRTARLCSPS